MTKQQSRDTTVQTLSVGETAKRLDISSDSVRNYCERGWLGFKRVKGNHRRILLHTIESFEARRQPKGIEAHDSHAISSARQPPIDEDYEIYYLGNEKYLNTLEQGYICNLSFLVPSSKLRSRSSSILVCIGTEFGGGTFRIVRVRNAEIISERIVSLPGPTKIDVAILREVAMDA